ncbi:DUF2867 domain-containing protein [Phycicoccus ginsengisoli]
MDLPDLTAPLRGTHTGTADVPVDRLWQVVTSVGGDTGWFTPEAVWTARCGVDRLLGGPGRRRTRPDRPPRAGDLLDFWRVEEVVATGSRRRLVLSPLTRLPGAMLLYLEVTAEGRGRSRLTVRHGFTPSGPAGLAYGLTTAAGDQALYAWMRTAMLRAAQGA